MSIITTIASVVVAVASIVKAVLSVKKAKTHEQRAEVAERVLRGITKGIQAAAGERIVTPDNATTQDVVKAVLKNYVKPALKKEGKLETGVAIAEAAGELLLKLGTKVK